MRFLLLLLMVPCLAAAATPDEEAIVKTINSVFAAMTAHDAAGAAAGFAEDARATVIGAKVTRRSREELIKGITAPGREVLERIWNPTVLVRGNMATVWAEYDFYLDKKFHHCGIDAFFLQKTADGWKISDIQWTSETTGCAKSPLGEPKF